MSTLDSAVWALSRSVTTVAKAHEDRNAIERCKGKDMQNELRTAAKCTLAAALIIAGDSLANDGVDRLNARVNELYLKLAKDPPVGDEVAAVW